MNAKADDVAAPKMPDKPDNIPLTIPGLDPINGNGPVVVIGPNGAGKSRLMRRAIKADRFISAQRRTYLNERLPNYPSDQATAEFRGQLNNSYSEPWMASNEIDTLFAGFMAEHFSALEDNNQAGRAGKGKPYIDNTLLARLEDFWEKVFPGRTISFKNFTPLATSNLGVEKKPYPAKSMSDGERACLYLAARILKSEPGLLLIDEPELHLHKKLAVDYWNTLEAMRPDIRFVYITHDLHFALSRTEPIIVMIQDEKTVKIVNAAAVQSELAELLLGAATLTINAKRIIFFEGVSGKGLAHNLFKKWVKGPTTAAVGVGGRNAVINAGTSFSNLAIVANAEIISLIDRDHGPEEVLAAMKPPARVLALHEIESLFALPAVLNVVAKHIGNQKPDIWLAFLTAARAEVAASMSKIVADRFRARFDELLHESFTTKKAHGTVEDTAKAHSETIEKLNLKTRVAEIFAEEHKRVQDAMAKDDTSVLVVFSGKQALKLAANVIGLPREAYAGIVLDALGDSKHPAHQVVIDAMSPYLPER